MPRRLGEMPKQCAHCGKLMVRPIGVRARLWGKTKTCSAECRSKRLTAYALRRQRVRATRFPGAYDPLDSVDDDIIAGWRA